MEWPGRRSSRLGLRTYCMMYPLYYARYISGVGAVAKRHFDDANWKKTNSSIRRDRRISEAEMRTDMIPIWRPKDETTTTKEKEREDVCNLLQLFTSLSAAAAAAGFFFYLRCCCCRR